MQSQFDEASLIALSDQLHTQKVILEAHYAESYSSNTEVTVLYSALIFPFLSISQLNADSHWRCQHQDLPLESQWPLTKWDEKSVCTWHSWWFFKVVTGTLFELAIIMYTTHTYICAEILKQFSTEDVFLLFTVVCLCCLTGLMYSTMWYQYDLLTETLHSAQSDLC